jgi:hypothetical protein
MRAESAKPTGFPEEEAMHHSRLSTFVIDCQGPDVDEAARFWSAALGRRIVGQEDQYRMLEARPDEAMLLVQQVDHPSRIHLDIESDDLEAEVKRLENLGARRLAHVKRWWVMEAPTGQRFCVVNPQRGPLAGRANQWT